ncbi:MAG: SUMF1/EgtB/PvdO family nonheme iron enzyme [Candidatus Omnitrophica bacterium]|nr:SUMF1/EgtB/PvdO family nonheme iron enzyme [Candidatus Omnitrophota bacterium]
MVKKRRIFTFCATLFLLIFLRDAYAAHLKISNYYVSEFNTLKHTAKIQFDISWDNAWKNELNCDGVWVFVKFKLPDRSWEHVSLKEASDSDFNYISQAPSFFSAGDNPIMGLWVPKEKTGAFLFRTEGIGNISSKNVTFIWDYAKDGVLDNEVSQVKIKVFGLEMVYIPQGKHYVGDPQGPDGPDNCFYTYPNNGAYLIQSEDEILVDKVEGALYCDQDNERSRDDTPFVIPKEFPKGYKPFWIMKYELSTQQFVDFLNCLTRAQQQKKVASDISGDEISNYYVMTNTDTEKMRNTVVCAKKGNGTVEPVVFYTYAPARACNFLSWSDITSFADWSGLRPITELEYEKACRGTQDPVPNEAAWGTTDIGRPDTFDGPDGSGYEVKVPKKGIVNAGYGSGIAPFEAAAGKTKPDNPGYEGPLTCGLFENSQHEGVPKRINDGASFYGVMELSGNLWERCVTVGHKIGRKFRGVHGDGKLDPDGFSDVEDWPGRDGAGAGNRGGVWSSPGLKYLRFALRFAANFPKSEDGKHSGCRLGY